MPDIFQVPIWYIESPDETQKLVPMLLNSRKLLSFILGVNEKDQEKPLKWCLFR